MANRTRGGVDVKIISKLSEMLYENNVHAQSFWMDRDILKQLNVSNLKLRLISNQKSDRRIYNQPIVSEVAALIVGDVDTAEKRDIIMETQSGDLQRINEYHTHYLEYQYPLFLPYSEDGYRPNVKHRANTSNPTDNQQTGNSEMRFEIFHGKKRRKEIDLQSESGWSFESNPYQMRHRHY